MSGFNFEVTISALTVFLQGIFSFFSPCVLPLDPLLGSRRNLCAENGREAYIVE